MGSSRSSVLGGVFGGVRRAVAVTGCVAGASALGLAALLAVQSGGPINAAIAKPAEQPAGPVVVEFEKAPFKMVDQPTLWATSWGKGYDPGVSSLVVAGFNAKAGEFAINAAIVDAEKTCGESVAVVAQGSFVESISADIPGSELNDEQLKALDLVSQSRYLVSGKLTGAKGNTIVITAIWTDMVFVTGESLSILTPITETESIDDADQEVLMLALMIDEQLILQAKQAQPAPQPAPPTGTINCFSAEAYLDCTDDCDTDYDTAVAGCNAIHATCMGGAANSYALCVGGCNCAGNPGLWCSCRCAACGHLRAIQEDLCWVARIGCLTGAELGKTACYSGCFIGSWQSFPNPPGCPSGWTSNPFGF